MRVSAAVTSLVTLIALGTAARELPETQTANPRREISAAEPAPADKNAVRSLTIENGSAVIRIPDDGEYDLIVSHLDPLGRHSSLRLSRDEANSGSLTAWRKIVPFRPRPIARDAEAPETRAAPIAMDRPADPERTFWIHTTTGPLNDPLQYSAVRAKLLQAGKWTRVYLDSQCPRTERIDRIAAEAISELDEAIIPECTRRFGLFRDVDGDGKIAILLTPWLDRLQNGRTSLHGFVRGSDFDPRVPTPLGNGADLIYLNSEMDDSISLRTLLGHEYFHLLSFGQRVDADGYPYPAEDDWLNEAEAHIAENLLGGDATNLRHRRDAFLTDPAGTPLVVRNYYRSGLWRDDRCRGATWLFLRWCTDQFGDELLAKLMASPRTGIRNLEDCTGVSFAILKQRWALALLYESRGDAPTTLGYRYFNSSPGAELFGRADFRRLKMADPDLKSESFQTELAPTGTLFVALDRSEAGPVRVTCHPPERLQLTLVPRRAKGARIAKTP